MRAIIYARVSDDSQRSNYSIPTQVATCKAYIEENGHTLVGNRFVDPVTGFDATEGVRAFVDDYTSTEEKRPMLDEAIEYIEENDVDLFVVLCLDRLARDPYIRHVLEVTIEDAGAKVHYVQGDYDDTPEGEIRKDLDSVFAKWENAKRTERMERGKREAARRGKYTGGRRPYGYNIVDGYLRIREDEARVIRIIFDMCTSGESLNSIKEYLNEQGFPTVRGKPWYRTTVRKILTNTMYVGYAYYNKHTFEKKKLVKKPREDWIRFETPPIITERQFQEAARVLADNRERKRRKPTHFYLLSGMIRCLDCGKAYIGQSYRNRDGSPRLNYRHPGKPDCRNHNKACHIVDDIVWESVKRVLLDPECLLKGYEDMYRDWERKNRVRQKRIAEFETKLELLRTQQMRLTEIYLNPESGMSEGEYLAHRNRLQGEMENLSSLISENKKELDPILPPEELENIQVFSSEIREVLEGDVPDELKRQILQELNITVYMNPEKVRIEGWVGVLETTLRRNVQKTAFLIEEIIR